LCPFCVKLTWSGHDWPLHVSLDMVADEGCVEDEREPFASKKKEAIEELELDYHCCFTVVDLNIRPS